MQHTLITTQDGSNSLLHNELDETYHSTHGAMTESVYVFIEKGLSEIQSQGVSSPDILEVGFGTGLNVFLTWQKAVAQQQRLQIVTIEPFPIEPKTIAMLNYLYGQPMREQEAWAEIHATDWGQWKVIGEDEGLSLYKAQVKLEDFDWPSDSFDLIYFDAFAPKKQPEVWSYANLEKCHNLLRDRGILVTYCSQGQFRRDLLSVGFDVEKLPGPPGKREMVRAVKRG